MISSPFFAFSDFPGELRNGTVEFRYPDNKTQYRRGMPLESDLVAGFKMGHRYCNFVWFTPGLTALAVDYLDLNKYFFSK